MAGSHPTARILRPAFPFAVSLGDGRTVCLRDFDGIPVVLALFAAADTLDHSETAMAQIRAELRGLGAVMVLISPGGVWCFRPDDEVELLGGLEDLSPATLAATFEGYGLAFGSNGGEQRGACGLYVIDDEGRLRFETNTEIGSDLAELARALAEATRELYRRSRSWTISRRELLVTSLVTGFAAAFLADCAKSGAPPRASDLAHPAAMGGEIDVTLDVNGVLHRLRLEPRVTLLDALRERLGLTGTKKGCDQGQCGACTVLVDGRRINACLTLAVMADSAKIVTIEGLANGEHLHPMQQAFIAEDAFQCGYCTPGQIVSAVGLLRERRAPSVAEIREHMSGNICRCGAYPNIVAAIERVVKDAAT